MKKLEKLPAWQLNNVKSKKRSFCKHKERKNSPLGHSDGHLSSQKCGVGTEIAEVQRMACAPR